MEDRIRACRLCGRHFDYGAHKRRVCHQCRPRGDSTVKTRQCEQCGKSFATKWNEIRHCSYSCANRATNLKRAAQRQGASCLLSCPIPWATCSECGRQFIARPKRTICSRPCELAKGRRLWQEGHPDRHLKIKRECVECGNPFEYERFNNDRIYCKKSCQRKADRRNHPEMHKAQNARRRAVKRNASTERFTHREIFERDAWKCGICGVQVNPLLRFPHLLSPTLDHIIALALGGSHTRSNVQLAHLICNSEKGAGAGGQLRLFG